MPCDALGCPAMPCDATGCLAMPCGAHHEDQMATMLCRDGSGWIEMGVTKCMTNHE